MEIEICNPTNTILLYHNISLGLSKIFMDLFPLLYTAKTKKNFEKKNVVENGLRQRETKKNFRNMALRLT